MNNENESKLIYKYKSFELFLKNVSIAWQVMDDNSTREQFDKIYYDICKDIKDPGIEIYAPPLPHLGRYVEDVKLTSADQTLIIHHGTLLMQYLSEKVKSKEEIKTNKVNTEIYVHLDRINELTGIKSNEFDLTKLIQLCKEINIAYQNDCYYSVAMLLRSIVDHVSPIFGYKNFSEFSNNNNKLSVSAKESMKRLDESCRKISDGILHQHIRKKESLPNTVTVNYTNELDILLSEILNKLKGSNE